MCNKTVKTIITIEKGKVTMKKALSLILTLVMVFALATTAFAAETDFTIKLTGTTATPTAGHTYTVYQIFTGALSETDGILSDVKYGKNYSPNDTAEGVAVPDADLEAITDANAFADKLINDELLEGEAFGTLNSENNWTLENVPAGYYLIVDTTENLPSVKDPNTGEEVYDTRSAYIVQVVDDVDMAPKSGTVTVIKKVKDVNDSTGAGSDWQDSADYDIGDTVPYQITATFTDINEFDAYEVEFTDTMSKGLTYNNNAVVTLDYKLVGSNTVETKTIVLNITESDYTGEEEDYQGGKVYKFSGDLVELAGAKIVNATVTINYTCTLNNDALTGEPGNPNKVNLKFNRNPEKPEQFTTPDDVNIVFTFKTDVNKVDPEKNPLTGAEFALEKFIASASGTVTYKGVQGDWSTLTLVKNDAGTVFSFKGLDDGYYRVTETKAPDGYNSIDPIYFTVTADHEVLADDPKLTNLEADVVKADGSAYTEQEIIDGNIASFTVTKADGNMSTKIVNKAGILLPSTGGIGTTMFYIIGAVLVLAAIVLFVTRRRMATSK